MSNKLFAELIELSLKVEDHNKIQTTSNIIPTMELTGEVELPFTFKCEALHPGVFKGISIQENEIIKAKDTIFDINERNIPNNEINKDHKGNRKFESGVDDVIGRVIAADYDLNKKAYILTGQIYDKGIALKIMNRVLKFVSLRINPQDIIEEGGMRVAKGLSFEELSVVRAPGDPDAHISEF